MEPGPSGSRGGSRSAGGNGGGGIVSMPQRSVVQMILDPIPGPSNRPYLAQPVRVPQHFLVPPEQLLPHQIASGVDIGNVFKLLNGLQNRIALACSQHQYLRDPLNQPRPPDDGGYKPLTPQAAVRDIRSLCRQQRSLMEKLRRYNCINDGKCYDSITNGIYTGICINCERFAASKIRNKMVSKALRKQKARVVWRSLKKLAASSKKIKKPAKRRVAVTGLPAPAPPRLLPPSSQPSRKRRRKQVNSEPPHPDTYLTKEQFLSELGLVTLEEYRKVKAASKKTERRRRTTANPKYKTSVVVDSNEAGSNKRSRRSDPSSLEVVDKPSTLSSPTGAERRRAKQKRYECSVCEKKGVTVECSNCLSGFHPDCIRVTASKAKPPSTVPVCPNCVPCNPNIRSSECILLSRKISRPSIMGLKSDSEPVSGNRRNAHSPRSQKASTRRRAATKTYSKAARRNASAAKAKKQSFKPPTQGKPRKAKTSTRKSDSKRTLNHSLAVAAAAAVPAYCTSSVDTTTAVQEKATGSQTNRKRKSASSKAGGKKLCKTKQANTATASEQRGETTKPEIASTIQPSSCKTKESAAVKKALPAKPLPLVSSDERSNCITKKHSTKLNDIQDGDALSTKNSPTVACTQTFHAGGSKVSSMATQQKGDANNRLKQSKSDKMEESVVPVESEAQSLAVAAAATTNKKGKGNGAKPGPVDPLCMKRTMMAMSAAAGLVMSASGGKNSPNSTNSHSPSPSQSNSPEKTVGSDPKPATTATNYSCDPEISAETRVQTFAKSPSPLTNLNNKFCEKDLNKVGANETTGKIVQKSAKANAVSHFPVVTDKISGNEMEKTEQPIPTVTADKTAHKPTKNEALVKTVEIRDTKNKRLKSQSKEKVAQKVSKSTVNATIQKNKLSEKEANTGETMSSGVQNVVKSLTTSLPRSSTTTTKKTPDLNEKLPQKQSITSAIIAVKSKPPKAEIKKSKGKAKEKKVKPTQKLPTPAIITQLLSQKNKSKSDKPMNKKETAATTKPKKVRKPPPKMDAAMEQSVNDTINKVIQDAVASFDANRKEERIESVESKNSYEFDETLPPESPVTCTFETAHSSDYTSLDDVVLSTSYTWEPSLPTDDYGFSYNKYSISRNTEENDINSSDELERPSSPASSSIKCSPGSEHVISDSEDDLLSIPDTAPVPYLEIKRLERPGPFLDLSALDRHEEYKRNLASGITTKRGRGRGRGGKH